MEKDIMNWIEICNRDEVVRFLMSSFYGGTQYEE